METVDYTAAEGTTLELQVLATTVAYVTPQLGGSVAFTQIHVVLPEVKGLTVLR